MTKGDLFKRVANHLIAQGTRSLSNGQCAYRGEGGLKCAVGVLISDELYRPEMESWHRQNEDDYPYGVDSVAKEIGLNRYSDLLHELQCVHDCEEPDDWPSLLTEAATKWCISWRNK